MPDRELRGAQSNPNATEATDDAPSLPAPAAIVEVPCEAAILDVLFGVVPGESAAAGFARRELALRELFATLTIAESRMLHGRLRRRAPGDRLAARFARLILPRQQRLLAFLTEAPRRAALGLGYGTRV